MVNTKATIPARVWWRRALEITFFLPVAIFFLLIVLPFGLILWFVFSVVLHMRIWRRWCRHGKDVLFVYSNSPIWHDYLTERVIPRIEHRAVILNWSERKQWPRSLARSAFELFRGTREFNPMAVVFRPYRRTRTFRFYQPFRDFKHGKTKPLEELERDFFACIGEPTNEPR